MPFVEKDTKSNLKDNKTPQSPSKKTYSYNSWRVSSKEIPKWVGEYPRYLTAFKRLLSVQSKSGNEADMRLYVIRELEKIKRKSQIMFRYWTDKNGNILVNKGIGKSHICFCSHLDTVHKKLKEYRVVFTKKRGIFKAYSGQKQVGIGGDDKCGIFLMLWLLKYSDKPMKCVFFSDEEIGGTGSHAIKLDFFENVGLLFGLDRRGHTIL